MANLYLLRNAACAFAVVACLAWRPVAHADKGFGEVPAIDGHCAEYDRDMPIAIDSGIKLHIRQNDHFVWICISLPGGSHGITDMRVKTDGVREPLILHVSAGLGEWPADAVPAEKPISPAGDKWWNSKGWTANPVRLSEPDDDGQTRFLPSGAREFKLSKTRFGTGPWRMRLTISSVAGSDGRFKSIIFPGRNEDYFFLASPLPSTHQEFQ